jgi:hypothetical protein
LIFIGSDDKVKLNKPFPILGQDFGRPYTSPETVYTAQVTLPTVPSASQALKPKAIICGL